MSFYAFLAVAGLLYMLGDKTDAWIVLIVTGFYIGVMYLIGV